MLLISWKITGFLEQWKGEDWRNKDSTGGGGSYMYAQQLESWGRRMTTSSNQPGVHSKTLHQKKVTETNKQKNPNINSCSLLSLFGKRLITAWICPLNSDGSRTIYIEANRIPSVTFESLKEGNLRLLNSTYSWTCLGFMIWKCTCDS